VKIIAFVIALGLFVFGIVLMGYAFEPDVAPRNPFFLQWDPGVAVSLAIPFHYSSALTVRSARSASSMSDDFGIGAQVVVRALRRTLPPWPDEPSGVIVRTGGSRACGRVWGDRGGGGRIRWVEFDEPQSNSDGGSPFLSRSRCMRSSSELAPPMSDLGE
jgi:hypothetical protein